MTGTIKRLDTAKGYGFIKAEDGKDYFFHRSAVRYTTFETLEEGQDVRFEDVDSLKGLRAEDVELDA
jgi:cold shock protein